MDYEKKYKEALERMKSWVRGEHPECFTEAQKAAEFIFPELKESEDKQSKKWILEYLYDGLRKSDEQFKGQFKVAIAWLEKQGEQKLYVNDNAKEMFIKALERVEEQNNKGYKLTDCDKNSWWEDFKNYTFCTIEQKPAEWSEKDETTKNNISHIIRQYDKISKRENKPCWYIGDCLLWMQNIKDRVQLQPKQDWNEEDETVLNNLIYALANDRIGNDRDEYISYLKSLKDRNTWKPSKEQMYQLRKYSDNVVLRNLYYKLKKLKG